MPLFKGQGCKSLPDKAISYITDENKAEYVSEINVIGDDYAQQFQKTNKLFRKGTKFEERKYYHFKLSCDRADNVSAAEHQMYAEEMAEYLFSNFECIIATHTDTDTVHSHIIVNAVSFVDGHKLHCNNREYGRMKDLANEIGAEHGFSALDFRKPAKKRITSAERVVELKGGTVWKKFLRDEIDKAKNETATIEEFEKHLNGVGIQITRNTDKTIAFKHPDRAKAIRGDKLGAEYTKPAIMDRIAENEMNRSFIDIEEIDRDVVRRMRNNDRSDSRDSYEMEL